MSTVPQQKNNVMLGSVYMLAGAFSFSVMSALVRAISVDIHPFAVAFWRTLLALMILLPIMVQSGALRNLKTENTGLHFLRGVIASITLVANFYAFSTIPLAEAVSYSFAAPIFTTIGAVIFLKEKIRLPRILAIIAGFAGMLVLLRPGHAPMSLGVIAALFAAVNIAFVIILVRVLARTDQPQVITFYSLVFTLPVSLIFAFPFWSWPSLENFWLLLALGVTAAVTQLCLSKAISEAEASALMPLDFTRLIFSALIGYFFFAEQPELHTYIGAGIIMGSVLYATHRERLNAKREKGAVPPASQATVKPGGDGL